MTRPRMQNSDRQGKGAGIPAPFLYLLRGSGYTQTAVPLSHNIG